MNRREFIGGAVAFAAVRGGFAAEPGLPPPWRPGELELHFIATGVGENMFYRLPDGTTWLNDCGDYWYDRDEVPPVPSKQLLGAEWVVRYLKALGVGPRIDYMTISHWHTDHAGDPKLRHVVTKDGRRVCGAALVGEHFDFDRYYDFEYPAENLYGTGDHSRLMMREYVEFAKKNRGLRAEPFRVGALDQICLRHDPEGKYRGIFHVRNLAANGVVWTGEGEKTRDVAAECCVYTKRKTFDQNAVSMALKIEYGKFSFYTGGDISHRFLVSAEEEFDLEAHVARMAGRVTVAKTNHHGTPDAMGPDVVKALAPEAFVSCIWHKAQINDVNMRWMSSRELYPGDRRLYPTVIPKTSRELCARLPWWKDLAAPGHVIVKVAPGGDSWKIYSVPPNAAEQTGAGQRPANG